MRRLVPGSIGPRSAGSSPAPLEARLGRQPQHRRRQRRDVPPALSSTATSPALRTGYRPVRWDFSTTIVTQQCLELPPGSAPVLSPAVAVVAEFAKFRNPGWAFGAEIDE